MAEGAMLRNLVLIFLMGALPQHWIDWIVLQVTVKQWLYLGLAGFSCVLFLMARSFGKKLIKPKTNNYYDPY